MLESIETTDRRQLNEAYRDPTQLEMRRGMSDYKSPKFSLQKEVLKALDLRQGERLFEIGCGKGELINSFPVDSSYVVLGSDLSFGMVREASKITQRFIVSDSQKIPFGSDSFDAVAAVNMIYHVPNKDAALSEIFRVLKKDGRLVLTGHSIKDRDLSRKLREIAALNFDISDYPHPPAKFNTENGMELLKKHFSHVDLRLYSATIVVPEIAPHLAFFDSMRYFWNQKFTDAKWQNMLDFAQKFLDSEMKVNVCIKEETISGIFVCRK